VKAIGVELRELSGGKLGYIYLSTLERQVCSLSFATSMVRIDKQGLVIDERFNGGGSPGDYILETLSEISFAYYTFS